MNNQITLLSLDRISEIMETAEILNSKDLEHCMVHNVVHEGESKVIVSSSVGQSFKLTKKH
jgi:hypothetical protein